MIAEIGDWVIGEVAAISATWHRDGFDRRLAFNISPRQIDRADFFAGCARPSPTPACRCR